MKTETEKLKEARDRQYVQERHQEVNAYLMKLFAEFDSLMSHSNKWMRYELAAVVVMIIASFGPTVIWGGCVDLMARTLLIPTRHT